MSKRDALRALSKKFPTPQEVKSILDGLGDQPDRIAAIVAAAIAESFLQRAIISKLKAKEPSLIGELFNNRGPMAEFHSKILIAEAFGVIGANHAKEYHRIKVIRNVFAHAIVPVTFETVEIAKEVDDFIVHQAMTKEAKYTKEGSGLWGSRKATFLLMVKISCIIIDHDQKDITGEFLTHYDV